MKQLYVFLCTIIWRDLFKHRWAFIVDLYRMPTLEEPDSLYEVGSYRTVPVISKKPVKRPLSQSYHEFVKEHERINNLVITGSKWKIKSLGNVGSFKNEMNWNQQVNPFQDKSGGYLEKLLRMATAKAKT